MQQLWKEGTDWDQRVSDDIEKKWNELRNELPLTNDMVLPRWIQFTRELSVQIHGFCNASEKGYGAVIYSRVFDLHDLQEQRGATEEPTFIGRLESLIDANPYLAPVQKLQYLLNYVQGEAKESIAHTLLCNENYVSGRSAMTTTVRFWICPRWIPGQQLAFSTSALC